MGRIDRVMISQPMAGLTDFEIDEARERAFHKLEAMGFEVVNTNFGGEEYNPSYLHNKRDIQSIPLYYLAKSLEAMSKCNAIYFCKGWENARGCKIEHEAAVEYGLECHYE